MLLRVIASGQSIVTYATDDGIDVVLLENTCLQVTEEETESCSIEQASEDDKMLEGSMLMQGIQNQKRKH